MRVKVRLDVESKANLKLGGSSQLIEMDNPPCVVVRREVTALSVLENRRRKLELRVVTAIGV